MAHQRFTPSEANRTLPLVRRVVTDILAAGERLRALSPQPGGSTASELREIESELRRLMGELERIGCQYKDWSFDVGLVDFPGELEGRPVLWCWRSDEDNVTWYHDEEAGYAGRTPIPPELLQEDDAPADCGERAR